MPSPPSILVTRPEPDAVDTAARLSALGLHPIIAPLLQMHTLPIDLPPIKSLAALALTSANALRALEDQDLLNLLTHLPCYTVGDRTADHARIAGFSTVISANGSFDDLVSLLSKQHFSGTVFYPTADRIAGNLSQVLAPDNIHIHTAPIYQMRATSELPEAVSKALIGHEIRAISLYSRHTAEIFCDLAKDLLSAADRRQFAVLCLSENVAEPMIANHFTSILLADYPSQEAMMALALSFARDQIR